MTGAAVATYSPPNNLVKVSYGPWEAREMRLTWDKVSALWDMLCRHKTLFSDLTRGDVGNYVRLLIQPHTYWLEICDENDLVGIIYFDSFDEVVDIRGHMVFFDRKPAEKVELCRLVVQYMFENFAINRITVPVPALYHATARLMKKLGLTHEGTMRDKMLIGGRWHDVLIFGITRREVLDAVSTG